MHRDHSVAMSFSSRIFFATFYFILLWSVPCSARQLFAVDLGVDFAKAATLGVSEGVMRTNIVLNDHTNRKSPNCVALRFVPYDGNESFRHIERVFAEPAHALEVRFPANVICGASVLAGLPPPADTSAFTFAVAPHAPRGSAAVRIGGTGGARAPPLFEFSAEEIVGMLLGHLRLAAERGIGGEPLRHAALTVPPHASVAQRQALVDAAALTGLRAVRLVHSTTAAAVQLALQNTELFFSADAPVRYVMIYDMGSSGAEAAVFRVAPAAHRRERARVERVSSASDTALGGRGFDRCLARYVERELFPKERPPLAPLLDAPSDSAASRRALSALLRASREARERLSANSNAPFVAPGIRPGGGDFVATVTREAFERACAEPIAAAVALRDAAVAAAAPLQATGARGLARLEVVGGATRTPLLLERLGEGIGRAPDRTLNGDEAVVTGAAALGGESAGIARLRIRVVERATNDVYFRVAPSVQDQGNGTEAHTCAEGSDCTERQLLFEKEKTEVPIVHSLHFANRTADFKLTLESGEGSYVRPYTISGVADALSDAQTAVISMNAKNLVRRSTVSQNTYEVITLEQTEVIVEASMSESGIPWVSNAYILAFYRAEILPLPNINAVTNQTNNHTGDEGVAGEEIDKTPKSENGSETDVEGNVSSTSTDNIRDRDSNLPKDIEDKAKEKDRGVEEVHEKVVNTREKEDAKGDEEPKHDLGKETDEQLAEADENMEKKRENTTRVFTRGYALQILLPKGRLGINLTPDEAIAGRDRLRALQLIDDERLLRSTLRNDVEALMLQLKTLPAWMDGPNGTEGDWRAVVAEVAEWFDDASDDVATAALQEQLDRLRKLKTE